MLYCAVLCCAAQVSGELYVWSGRNCVKAILAHRGSVNALFTCAHGVVSGGMDRKVTTR